MSKELNRESGIELLRLMAAFGIAFSHFLNKYEIVPITDIVERDLLSTTDGINMFLYNILRIPVTSAVDIFILTSGFFLCKSMKRNIEKPISLIVQMVFYGIVLYLISVLVGKSTFSFFHLIGRGIPASYFVTYYIIIYLFSPYLNFILQALSKKGRLLLLFMMLCFYSLWPMCLGIIEHFGLYKESWCTLSIGGSAAGYNIVTFVIMYCIGAIINLNEYYNNVNCKRVWMLIVALWIVLSLFQMVPIHSTPYHIARWYDNIFVILMACACFIAFKKMSFSSLYINDLAKAAFTIYIIHTGIFSLFDVQSVFQMPIYEFLPKMFFLLILVICSSWILYKIYNVLFSKLLKRISISIPYFE